MVDAGKPPSPLGASLGAAVAGFGTDGIRGRVGTAVTPALALQVGYWCGLVLPADAPVLIGTDSRSSGPMLVAALTAGLTAAGREVWQIGLCPTPAIPGTTVFSVIYAQDVANATAHLAQQALEARRSTAGRPVFEIAALTPRASSRASSPVYDWFQERLEIGSIADDISAKYVPPHVNIFYCLGGITFTCFLVQVATGFAMTFYYRPTVAEAFASVLTPC